MSDSPADDEPIEPLEAPAAEAPAVSPLISVALLFPVAATWLIAALAGGRGEGASPAWPAVLALATTVLSAMAFMQTIRLRRQLADQQLKIHELASRDSLSGAYNHVAFIEILDREFARSRRYGQPLSLLIFDLDFFKRIHDGYGSLVGANALRAFARVLQAGLRNVDAVGRLGSEEFAVMLPNTPAPQAAGLAERLREDAAGIVVRAPGGGGQESIEVRFTTSVGVAAMRTEDVGVEDLVRRAGAALASAKDLGRNRVEVAA
jgi:diguanylate cyclase (GGDEF)-like protein